MGLERLKAVVLLSGGMDSCVAAAMARQKFEIALLHAGYGQRTEARERRCFDQIADYWGVRERLTIRLEHLAQIGGSALTNHTIPVPPAFAGPEGHVPATYVPFRNTHLLAAAVSWAEVIGANAVFIGAVHEDSSGYPDCRPQYFAAFSAVVREGTRPGAAIEICTPVIAMSKAQIVRQGIALGAPLHLTWSCYQNEERACGRCESCVLRLRAFAGAGQVDPIPYQMP